MPRKSYAWCINLMPETARPLFLLLALAALVACAASPQQQQVDSWNQLQNRYPREQFLTAVGEGATLEAAQQQALFNLGQNFSVRVTGVTQSSNRLTSVKSEGEEQVETSVTLHTRVRRHTDQLVQGAEVYPADLVGETYRALAVLEKTKGRRILSSQLFELENRIDDALAQTDKLGDQRLESAGWLQRAIELAEVRDQRHQQLVVLGGASLPLDPSRAQLSQQLTQHIRALPFDIAFGGATHEEQQTVITNALAKIGIRQAQGKADYSLVVNLDQQQPFSRDGLHWQRAALRMQLRHMDKPQGEIGWELKSVAQQAGQLQSRMDQRIADTIEKKLIDELIALASELT